MSIAEYKAATPLAFIPSDRISLGHRSQTTSPTSRPLPASAGVACIGGKLRLLTISANAATLPPYWKPASSWWTIRSSSSICLPMRAVRAGKAGSEHPQKANLVKWACS